MNNVRYKLSTVKGDNILQIKDECERDIKIDINDYKIENSIVIFPYEDKLTHLDYIERDEYFFKQIADNLYRAEIQFLYSNGFPVTKIKDNILAFCDFIPPNIFKLDKIKGNLDFRIFISLKEEEENHEDKR